MNSIRLTVVVDDHSQRAEAPAEHGLCLHIKSGEQVILFDAGKSNLVVANLNVLGLAEPAPQWIALSHGHYDHTTGVPALLEQYPSAKLHFHPKLIEPKWILDPGEPWRYGGVPSAFLDLAWEYMQPRRCCLELIPGVYASGSVVGDSFQSFVPGRFYRNPAGHRVVDAFPDEQVLLVKTAQGVSILSGCMHTGLEATLKKAREIFPREPFYALAGGFHLEGKLNSEFYEFIRMVKEAGIQRVMPMHCTGIKFSEFLSQNAPDLYAHGAVGESIEL